MKKLVTIVAILALTLPLAACDWQLILEGIFA